MLLVVGPTLRDTWWLVGERLVLSTRYVLRVQALEFWVERFQSWDACGDDDEIIFGSVGE